MHLFDYCVITASHERQAETFRKLLHRRIEHGLYPREITFKVYADPPGGRIGSGGGTLWALHELLREEATAGAEAGDAVEKFLSISKILILHAGGESRRLPCYAPEGKLFAPVPAESSSVFPPVVLDLQLNLYLNYPWNEGEVVVGSGDVIIDFDTDSVPENRGDICGFAKAAPVDQGSRHGVFLLDRMENRVLDYFQKAESEFLLENAAFEGTDECALDIGIVSMSPRFVKAFLEAGKTPPGKGDAGSHGRSLLELLKTGETKFDIYLELMIASLSGLSFENYNIRIASRTQLSKDYIKLFYETFQQFPLHGILTQKSTFLHFGSLVEFPDACRAIFNQGFLPFYHTSERGELKGEITAELIRYNSSTDADIRLTGGTLSPNRSSFQEGCGDVIVEQSGGGNMYVGLTNLSCSADIPSDICIEERHIDNSIIPVIYGIRDTFKIEKTPANVVYCNRSISEWLAERALATSDIWPEGETADLFEARLFPAIGMEELIDGWWHAPRDPEEWRRRFLSVRRYNLMELNDLVDALDRDDRRAKIRASEIRKNVLAGRGWHSLCVADIGMIFGAEKKDADMASLRHILMQTDDPLLRQYREATIREVDDVWSTDLTVQAPHQLSFLSVSSSIPISLKAAVKKDQIVWARCPVRFDLAGGWTDTPPYTNRYGGQVVNMAVDLNGQPPIQVFVRPTKESRIRIHSIDLGVTETYEKKKPILDYRDPSSAFSLPKAAFCLLGLVSTESQETLEQTLAKLGSGIELTILCAVPKGSGLGTSSILGATILDALNRFFGNDTPQDELFLQVLEMEQMLTTGGGWQDQIGGVAGGVKYIVSQPSLKPFTVIHQLDSFLFTDEELRRRYTLFYTGATRLAKNILQEVVAGVNEASPSYLFTHNHLKELANQARRAVSTRMYSALAKVLWKSWLANKLMHSSTTNEEVEELVSACRPFFLGMKLLGAGGGGYALFASETEEKAENLRAVLTNQFEGNRARIVDFSLNKTGLHISVS